MQWWLHLPSTNVAQVWFAEPPPVVSQFCSERVSLRYSSFPPLTEKTLDLICCDSVWFVVFSISKASECSTESIATSIKWLLLLLSYWPRSGYEEKNQGGKKDMSLKLNIACFLPCRKVQWSNDRLPHLNQIVNPQYDQLPAVKCSLVDESEYASGTRYGDYWW